MLPGLGVAAAVLSAVVATFALASGIVVYDLTSVDPLAPPSGTLVLDPLRPGEIAARPLVLRGARAAATARRSAVPVAAATALVSPGRGAVDGPPPPANVGSSDPVSHVGGDGVAGPVQAVRPVPDRALRPAGATVQAVGALTDRLARRLRASAAALATRTEAGGDTVAAALADAGGGLREAVGGTGRALDRLLGGPPPP
jgi:hypothetical protein